MVILGQKLDTVILRHDRNIQVYFSDCKSHVSDHSAPIR